jgi:hypothetical protein
VGPPLPDVVLGSSIEQELPEGILNFRLGVLYNRQKPRKEQLEWILILETKDPDILQAMWKYPEFWKREEYEDDPRKARGNAEPVPQRTAQADLPW